MYSDQSKLIEFLFQTEYHKLLAYARAALADSDRAQDIVQDTFHEAILHKDTLQHHTNPQGWLMQTLKFKIKSSERAKNRYLLRFLSLETELPSESIHSEFAENDRSTDQMNAILTKIQQALKTEDYYLLKRVVIQGASHLQASKELGISVCASQKRLQRIRKELKQRILEYKKQTEYK